MTEQLQRREQHVERPQYTPVTVSLAVTQQLRNNGLVATREWYEHTIPSAKPFSPENAQRYGLTVLDYHNRRLIAPTPATPPAQQMDSTALTGVLLLDAIGSGNNDMQSLMEIMLVANPWNFNVFPDPDSDATIIDTNNRVSLVIQVTEAKRKIQDWLGILMDEAAIHAVHVGADRRLDTTSKMMRDLRNRLLVVAREKQIPELVAHSMTQDVDSLLLVTFADNIIRDLMRHMAFMQDFESTELYQAGKVLPTFSNKKIAAVLDQKSTPVAKEHIKTRPDYTSDTLTRALVTHAQQLIEQLSQGEMTEEQAALYSKALVFNAQMQERSNTLSEVGAEEQTKVQELIENMTGETLYALLDVLPPDLLDYLEVVCAINEAK